MFKNSLILLLFTALVMIGCNSDQKANKKADQSADQTEDSSKQKTDNAELTETYWKLVSLEGEDIPQHEDQKEAYIMLKSDEEKVTGNGSCNILNGTYETEGDSQISFSKMATTMMACPDMETEKQFLKSLGKVKSYGIKDDSLMLNDDKQATLAKFVSASGKQDQ